MKDRAWRRPLQEASWESINAFVDKCKNSGICHSSLVFLTTRLIYQHHVPFSLALCFVPLLTMLLGCLSVIFVDQ